jgi:hypothetical protein
MCELACDQTSDWIMVDPWEAIQSEYQPTAVVLDHVAHEINDVIGGIAPYPGAPREEYRRAHVSLLSGSDLLQTMSVRTPIPISQRLADKSTSNPASGVSPTWTTSSAATASSSLSVAGARCTTRWRH